MSKVRKIFAIVLILVVLLAGGAVVAFMSIQGPALLNMFTSGSARLVCSALFVAHRDEAYVRKQDLGRQTTPGKYLGLVKLDLDYDAKVVSASLYGFGNRTAVFREGIGCTPNMGISEAQLRQQGSGRPTDLAHPDPEILWPEGSATLIDQLPQGIDGTGLLSALQMAFAEPDPGKLRNTRAVVVVHQGRIVAEQYAEGFNQTTGHLSNSMAKTISGALIGIQTRKGILDVNARAPIAEWSGVNDPRRDITLNHLLRMQSGLVFEEKYDRLKSDITSMYTDGDLAGYAAAKPLETAPGSKWKYSTGTSNILGRIISENAGDSFSERFSFPMRELFEPLGMRSAVMEVDGKGNFIGGTSVYASARDFARFGLLYLRNGEWNGQQILPEGWVEYTLTPVSDAPAEYSYGVQIWLNNNGTSPVRRWPDIPADAFAMVGHQGQYVVMIPSLDLIVVRLGLTEYRNWSINQFVSNVADTIRR